MGSRFLLQLLLLCEGSAIRFSACMQLPMLPEDIAPGGRTVDWRRVYECQARAFEEAKQASAQRMRQLTAREAQQKSSRCAQVQGTLYAAAGLISFCRPSICMLFVHYQWVQRQDASIRAQVIDPPLKRQGRAGRLGSSGRPWGRAAPPSSRQRLLRKLGMPRGAGTGAKRPLINAQRQPFPQVPSLRILAPGVHQKEIIGWEQEPELRVWALGRLGHGRCRAGLRPRSRTHAQQQPVQPPNQHRAVCACRPATLRVPAPVLQQRLSPAAAQGAAQPCRAACMARQALFCA
jgi:hypothetical protein